MFAPVVIADVSVGSIFIRTWGPLYVKSTWICVGVQCVGILAACFNVSTVYCVDAI